MEIEKSKVSIEFLLFFRQSGDALFFIYARRLRGHTATNGFFSEFVRIWSNESSCCAIFAFPATGKINVKNQNFENVEWVISLPYMKHRRKVSRNAVFSEYQGSAQKWESNLFKTALSLSLSFSLSLSLSLSLSVIIEWSEFWNHLPWF